jgi:hypothetical protein
MKDILAVLDKLPVWHQLKVLPEQVEALERNISELKGSLRGTPEHCPACGSVHFKVTQAGPDPTFGQLGATRRTYTCSACKHSEERIIA